jgi:group I intron endonuclease
MQGCIYKLVSPSGKVYIGQSRNINKRFGMYSRFECKNQRKLYPAICKYGWDNFTKEILISYEDVEQGVLNYKETAYIAEYEAVDKGYNCCPIGNSHVGVKYSPESLDRMRQLMLGKRQTEESKAKISATLLERYKGEPHFNKGRTLTAEHRLSISNGLKATTNRKPKKARVPIVHPTEAIDSEGVLRLIVSTPNDRHKSEWDRACCNLYHRNHKASRSI